MDKTEQDRLKKAAGIEAAKLVENGMTAGLGTGSKFGSSWMNWDGASRKRVWSSPA